MALHPTAHLVPFGPLFGMVREDRPTGPPLDSSLAVFELIKKDAQADREWLQAFYLGPKNNVIERVLEFVGSVDSASIWPREIAKHALQFNATGVILTHNHPSGDPEPSACDRQITQAIFSALALFQIKLLDHIIAGPQINGKQAYCSFADHGIMDDIARINPSIIEVRR
ncbi:MAG TPA: JAB domain-containing protein [Rectinemataceae bacterium]|nr:JAB domain-containing protein [Rectinemataceae bacterium]